MTEGNRIQLNCRYSVATIASSGIVEQTLTSQGHALLERLIHTPSADLSINEAQAYNVRMADQLRVVLRYLQDRANTAQA